jgi:hypothetical protein
MQLDIRNEPATERRRKYTLVSVHARTVALQ